MRDIAKWWATGFIISQLRFVRFAGASGSMRGALHLNGRAAVSSPCGVSASLSRLFVGQDNGPAAAVQSIKCESHDSRPAEWPM